MPISNQLIELTLEEHKLMVVNIGSNDVVSDPLERFILYSTIVAQNDDRTINIKSIEAQSHQSFYLCSQAVKKLIKNDWVNKRSNKKDKRTNDLIPTKKCIDLVRAYEDAKANSFIQKGIKLLKPKTNITIKDMLDANESQLNNIKEDILKS